MGNQLLTFDKKVTQEIGFKPETFLFLTEVGLPDVCAPNLEFQSEYFDGLAFPFLYSEYYDDPGSQYSGYYVIGLWNILGECPMCIDINSDDRIVAIHDDNWLIGLSQPGASTVYLINNSLRQLADSILAYSKFVRSFSFEEKSLHAIEFLKNDLIKIDSAYNMPNSFWKNELEVKLIRTIADSKK